MSIVKYKVGDEQFSFMTNLQVSFSEEHLFLLEEHLMEAIKEHKSQLNPQPRSGYIHSVILTDDCGITVTIKEFTKPGNLVIKERK